MQPLFAPRDRQAAFFGDPGGRKYLRCRSSIAPSLKSMASTPTKSFSRAPATIYILSNGKAEIPDPATKPGERSGISGKAPTGHTWQIEEEKL